ncbi:hypothetical protein ANN_06572 [Periplaneta americana]|uniref:PiggyBac transposable element-derived protein domain-containing protein n=1 Tax=Periplaneta americana TaxID=6978 RepID=A0ABQ8TE12_PERAM|nr:hypothetical protein ANN_06572 [Periplaneta americana]
MAWLVAPIKNAGRNVTTDRYCTSVDLPEDLYSDYNLTLVGTMQYNRKHIPEELKSVKGRELYCSIFAFTDPSSGKPPVTLVSYIYIKTKEGPNYAIISTLWCFCF